MKKIFALLVLVLVPVLACAEEEGPPLEQAPVNLGDKASLQHGAAIFINNCLNCHSASLMRYKKLEDLGLSEKQIKDNLLFTTDKIGGNMSVPVDPKISKAAFGVVPPDLSLIARSRSADWLYTYLRSFYRDAKSNSGWNNTVFPNVAMPNVLWHQQGEQALQVTERTNDITGDKIETRKLVLERPGAMSRIDFDRYVGDLVNYLVYMSEPAQTDRKQWGVVVLFFLAGFFVLAFLLKKEYWKDVR
jgi:ubiquinol-cytochrome c reductase cytochrome c1 subunit